MNPLLWRLPAYAQHGSVRPHRTWQQPVVTVAPSFAPLLTTQNVRTLTLTVTPSFAPLLTSTSAFHAQLTSNTDP